MAHKRLTHDPKTEVVEKKCDALIARKTKILKRKLNVLLPKLRTIIDCAWTGTFAADVIAGAIAGEPDADADLYRLPD